MSGIAAVIVPTIPDFMLGRVWALISGLSRFHRLGGIHLICVWANEKEIGPSNAQQPR